MSPTFSTNLVSVIIPCFNGAGFIASCVASISAQNVPSEIILVDDGSKDDSIIVAQQIAASCPVPMQVIAQPNQGPSVARNTGFAMAKGNYVCFLDVDDQYAPGFFARAIQEFDRDRTLTSISCRMEFVNSHRPVADWQRQMMECSLPSNVIVKMDIARKTGGFPVDNALRGKAAGEDAAYRGIIKVLGREERFADAYFKYRVHKGSHFDFFLDRSELVNDKLHLKYHSKEEADGSIAAAMTRYENEIYQRINNAAIAEFKAITTAATQSPGLATHLATLPGTLQPSEAFALYTAILKWPTRGRFIHTSGMDVKAIVAAAFACKDGPVGAGGARDKLLISPMALSSSNVATTAALNSALTNLALAESIELLSPQLTPQSIASQIPIRGVFIDTDPTYPAIVATAQNWLKFIAKNGLLVFRNVNAPGINQFYQFLANDAVRWKVVAQVQHLVVLLKLG